MIDRAANEQTKGSDTMDWHGDLPRGYHGAYLIGSAASPALAVPADTPQCHNNKAKCAESIEMAMHEKATRGDLPQKTEAAT